MWFNLITYYFSVRIDTTDWWCIKDWDAGWEVLNGTWRDSAVLLFDVRYFTQIQITQMEIAINRLCLTHFVSSKLWRETRGIHKPLPILLDWNCPKIINEKVKRDPDNIENMCREHICCSVNIRVLLFCAKGTSWGKFLVCYWQTTQPYMECIQRLIFTDRPFKKGLIYS